MQRFPGRPRCMANLQFYGCSQGCLLMSLGISIFLTILINLLIRAF